MITKQADLFFRSILDIEGFEGLDSSLNGLVADNDGGEFNKIAFAVDACLESFERAAASGAGMLFVHHGLFWGRPLRISGGHRERLKCLLDHNLALYAVHLPLDQHPSLGNNAALAELLGIDQSEPFGLYHGKKIGYKGKLKEPLTIEDAVKRIAFKDRPPLGVFPFGKRENLSCAVIAGSGGREICQAIDEGMDLYVTGELSHAVYHEALESGLNLIAGGHYSTEVWGLRRIMELCASQLNVEVEFIDVPTGL